MPGNRRPSPGLLLLALVVVCAVPLGVAAATGLTDDQAKQDQVETAGESPQPASATRADGGRSRAGHGQASMNLTTPPPTGIADIPPAGRAPGTTSPATPDTDATTTTTSPPAPAPATTAPPQVSPVDQVVALVNDARAHAATPCGPIQLEPRLTAAAQAHSDDMANRNFFDHANPDGVTWDQRIRATGIVTRATAENIARGQRSADQVMADWMASDGHRENIVNCAFNFIGIGLNRTAWTWTQDFAA
ncbi:MAG TPA: CAP domain-containing protein [Acidimicrobiales bacterium]|nr:CAP domain-containing protein [Acidimicrobiales bacterium]